MAALMKLQPGVRGDACFSDDGDRRLWLSRSWEIKDTPRRTLLWIGCNPSKADHETDDPTVRIETNYSRKLGFSKYWKFNVMDWIATHPKDLLAEEVNPCSLRNRHLIQIHARAADKIVLAYGAVHPSLQSYVTPVLSMLREYDLWCIGSTQNGSPRHPLRYLRMDMPLLPFKQKAGV